MKHTNNEPRIETAFSEAWDAPFKCDVCKFSKLYANTRELFVQREERYRNIL
jgi:hypothetical protein